MFNRVEVLFECFASSLLILIIGFHTLWEWILQCGFPLGVAIDECGSHCNKQGVPRVLLVSILLIDTFIDHMYCF